MKPSLTVVLCGLFLAYLGYSMWTLVVMFFPTPCVDEKGSKCIKPYTNKNLQMMIYTSVKTSEIAMDDFNLIWNYDNFSLMATDTINVAVDIPRKTRRNGTLYLHVFVCPKGQDIFTSKYRSHVQSPITTYAIPLATVYNLLGDNVQPNVTNTEDSKPVTHWRPKVTVNVMEGDIAFERNAIPAEVYKYLGVSPKGTYLPIVFIDQLNFRVRDLLPVNNTVTTLPLEISYSPISVGKLRMWVNMMESLKMLHKLGFSEKDTDEVKGIFSDTNFYLLMLTFVVAAFHLLFDFLAFKNEISFWKNRDTMVGLSSRGVVWRCVSQIIIFLYLMDEKTSLLVLIPAGIASIIEVWKVKKAFKMSLVWNGYYPRIEMGAKSAKEKETEQFDYEAMKYLSYVLYPLCIAGAVYSLVYIEHRSWYSWCVNCLVKGVYAFGFLFMLPQLFVNHKLKSVAHLPWRTFMYKAFNTFIDDVFAFIITMPTAHRLACFRDDVVFVVYLFQRWKYPVDKTRVNEYGVSYDDDVDKEKKD